MPEAETVIFADEMPDLAPMIYRQRLTIEGTCDTPVDTETIRRYLVGLSDVCGMTMLMDPVTYRSDRNRSAGWVHWESSGVQVYAWESSRPFFSADIFTCKAFDVPEAVEFTKQSFGAREIVFKSY
jgi:hypothetical protein